MFVLGEFLQPGKKERRVWVYLDFKMQKQSIEYLLVA